MDGWVEGWKDGWMEGKAGLRIAYSNKKSEKFILYQKKLEQNSKELFQ